MTLVITPEEIVRRAEATGFPGLLAKAPNWGRVFLGDIATILNGAPFSSKLFNNAGRGMPLVRIRDVVRGSTNTFYDGPFENTHIVESGDLLVGMDGDFKSAVWLGPRALLNQRVCRIEVSKPDTYDARFLQNTLQGYLDAIWSETSAVTVKHLSSRTLAKIPLPLPPLDEQRRIVAILEDHLSRLDAANESLKAATRNLTLLRASSLHDIVMGTCFGDASDESSSSQMPSGWQWIRLGDLVAGKDGFKRGPFGSALTKSTFVASGYQVYEQYAPINDDCLRARYFITEEHFHRLEAFAVRPGDFLVSCAGTLGRITRVPEAAVPGVINQALLRLRINDDLVSPEYFLWLMRSPYVQQQLVAGASGTAMVNLKSVKDLKTILLPLPPIAQQRDLVEEIQSRWVSAERLSQSVEWLNARQTRLRSSLLTAAFAGQLSKETSLV